MDDFGEIETRDIDKCRLPLPCLCEFYQGAFPREILYDKNFYRWRDLVWKAGDKDLFL